MLQISLIRHLWLARVGGLRSIQACEVGQATKGLQRTQSAERSAGGVEGDEENENEAEEERGVDAGRVKPQ